MKNLCVIPARAGSKGVPGKNTKPLNGTPLLEYTFQTALRAKKLDKIIISTDDPAAAQKAYSYNIEVPFLRPKHLAEDTTPTFDVIVHALNYFEKMGKHFDIICLLQPTCPFRNEGFIDKCIDHFIESGADSFCSVSPVPHQYNPHWVFKADDKGFLKVATGEDKIIPSRQLLPQVYARDGSVYLFRPEVIKEKNSLYGDTIDFLESDNQWHINIDTKDDWYRAEMIASTLCSVN